MIGGLPGYGTVWYDPNSIANILSLCHVASKYHVMYDSQGGGPNPNDPDGGGSFVVTKPNGTVFEFKASPGGLYFLDIKCTLTVLINTVAENKAKYTNEDYLKAFVSVNIKPYNLYGHIIYRGFMGFFLDSTCFPSKLPYKLYVSWFRHFSSKLSSF